MKSRKEEILALLQKNETGLTAGAVAEQLMIDRSNASRYLNELFKEKKITRSTGRLLSIQCQQSMKENKSM